jgi:hypothetical protein
MNESASLQRWASQPVFGAVPLSIVRLLPTVQGLLLVTYAFPFQPHQCHEPDKKSKKGSKYQWSGKRKRVRIAQVYADDT